VSEPTGEILPVWVCLLKVARGDRWYHNGPFESEAEAVEYARLAHRVFEVHEVWLPIEQARRRLTWPRLWARHPWARSRSVAEGCQGPEGVTR
jgi:hypothetical protein